MAKKRVVRNVMKHSRPVGISILAVLAWITAAFTLILGIIMLVGSAAIPALISNLAPQLTSWTSVGISLFILLGILFIAFAVLDFYIGRGLWRGQNWARILVVILMALSALSSIVSLDLLGLIISGVVIWYLWFYKGAVNYFK